MSLLGDVVKIILARPRRVVLIVILFTLVIGVGGQNINVTNDYRSLFDKGNPQVIQLEGFEKIYGKSDKSIIAIAPHNKNVFSKETLTAIENLTSAAWKTPFSTRVDSLTNYQYSYSIGDELIVEPLVENAIEYKENDLLRIQGIALNDSDIVGRLVSLNGDVAGLVIEFSLPPDQTDKAVQEVTNYLAEMLNQAHADNSNIDYYLTGEIPLHRTFADATRDDLTKLMPIIFLVIVLVASIMLRSLWGTFALLSVVLLSVILVMGFAGWIKIEFNPANAGIPIIIATIAVAQSVHIIASYLSESVKQGTVQNALRESLKINTWPIFLTSITTMIGFMSLNASDSPPFRVLGNLIALGVFCTLFLSLTFLPALLSILPIKAHSRNATFLAFYENLSQFVISRYKGLLIVSIILTISLAFGIFRLDLTDNWLKYFDDRYQFRKDTDFVAENLTGILTLEYSLNSGEENGITNPEYLHEVEEFAQWFREQPNVLHVQVFTDIMKRLNKNMNSDNPDFYNLPESSELAAQYLLLYELSLPFGKDLNNRINVDKSSTRMTVTLDTVTARQQQELDIYAQEWIEANAPGLTTKASGVSVVFANLSQRNISSMLTGTIIAMGLISLILIVVLKNFKIGLISLIPNFVPATLSFGLWGYLVGQVGLAGSVMTAFAFGIIVDDTIHFLAKYLKARKENQTPEEAIRTTFRVAGHALLTTTIILVCGFLVFATSGFEVSWVLGILVMITICFALICDFFFLPPLLLVFDRNKSG